MDRDIFPEAGSSRGRECRARCRWTCQLPPQAEGHPQRNSDRFHRRCVFCVGLLWHSLLVQTQIRSFWLACPLCLLRNASGRSRFRVCYSDALSRDTVHNVEEWKRPAWVKTDQSAGFMFTFARCNYIVKWMCLSWKGDLLFDFATRCCPNSSVDGESSRRNSAESNDIKTERSHRNSGENPPARNPAPALNRRKAFKNMNAADKLAAVKEKMEAISLGSPVPQDDRKRHTARIVVMGDDRVLGRLTKAYHAIRLVFPQIILFKLRFSKVVVVS